MHLQPSEFIAKTRAPDNNPQRITTYNMVPGTVVRLRNHVFVLVNAASGYTPRQAAPLATNSSRPGCGVTPPTCP